MKCSKCGKISPDGSRVCMMCGNPFPLPKYCQKCGNALDAEAVFCPKCGWRQTGEPSAPESKTQPQMQKGKPHSIVWKVFSWIGFVFGLLLTFSYMPSVASILFLLFALILIPINPLQNAWRSMKIKGTVKGILLVALFLVGAVASTSKSTQIQDHKKPTENIQKVSGENEDNPSKSESEPVLETTPDGVKVNYSLDISEYMKIDADVLFEYGNYLGGQKIVTVITAEDVDTYSSVIKAKTSNNDGYFFSIVCEFAEKSIVESVSEGTVITVVGTLEERDPLVDTFSFLETPTASLKNCDIVGLGEIAQELKDGASEQRIIGEEAKKAYEVQVAANKKAERDDYISQCETVKYSDVERNPDNYDGKKIKITGTVIQVSEGWFDSVTLRVNCNGNTWLVSYSRDDGESRILEDDNITCYGECTGVTSYTTVLGSTVTVPSLNMEYYD